jgi:hypothetical protein
MPDDHPPLPAIKRLHERHAGVTEAVAHYYAEATAICMQRHHLSPRSIRVSSDDDVSGEYLHAWEPPSERQIEAWANHDDATRDAAYGVVIAAAEAHLGLFVTGRAPIRSGADYLLSRTSYNSDVNDPVDFEGPEEIRLEVSGIDRCGDEASLSARVRIKVEQIRQAAASSPGIAGVVAFDLARVQFRRA